MTSVSFQQRTQRIEGVEVEHDVYDTAMQEDGSEEPPHFALGNKFVDLAPIRISTSMLGLVNARSER